MTTLRVEERRVEVPEHEEPLPGDGSRHANKLYTPMRGEGALPREVVVISDTHCMYNETENSNVFDLYKVGGLKAGEASNPFVHGVELAGPKGEVVRFRSVFDDGALVNAIDETVYRMLEGRLTALSPSKRILRMADGRHVPSAGVWKGRVTVKGVNRDGAFEIFKSNGAWAMLFGKPLLKTFNAVHDYTEDIVRIRLEDKSGWVVLPNQFANVRGVAAKLLANLTVDIKQLIPTQKGDIYVNSWRKNTKVHKLHGGLAIPPEGSTINKLYDNSTPILTDIISSPEIDDVEQINSSEEERSPIWLLDEPAEKSLVNPGTEQPVIVKTFDPSILTRKTDPTNPARVEAVLTEVTIGHDLSQEQTDQVKSPDIRVRGVFRPINE